MAYRGCDLILSCHEAETDHQKWLKTRNAGIGGSDAAVIMGTCASLPLSARINFLM